MKALSLMEPWAWLVAIGAKRIETRSWRTNYRGPLAIHAARTLPRAARELCLEPAIDRILAQAGYANAAELPRGAIVAVCELVDCRRIEPQAPLPAEPERSLGDFTPGRFAWYLDCPRRLASPIAARGFPGLWETQEVSPARL